MKVRTLIVDDEPLARERLRTLIEQESRIKLIGECANGREAVKRIRADSPDLLFLDVQMPEMGGFEVIQSLGDRNVPAIIFVTAFDEFAVRAFEVNAVDYLLKPFDRDRFRKALHKAVEQISKSDTTDLSRRISSLIAEVKSAADDFDRLAVKGDGRITIVRFDEIDWIEAANNYVSIHAGQQAHLHRETLSALEARLPGAKFARVSRSAIVNVERVRELQPMFHGDYVVILSNGTRVNLSRAYRGTFNRILGKSE